MSHNVATSDNRDNNLNYREYIQTVINPSFTDWAKNVPRPGIFLDNSRLYRETILPIFLHVHCSPTDTT
jgi:hypothetical protein